MFSIELTHRQEDKHLTSMEGRFLHHMKYECNMRGGFTRLNQNLFYKLCISHLSFPLFVKAKPEARSSQLSGSQR